MELKFLPLTKEYIEEVLEIERCSFPQPWTKEMFEREIWLLISNFFITLLNSKVIGYGGFWIVHDEAHLVNLAVHPDFRRKGYGRGMLGFIIREILKHPVNRIILEVRKSNESAQKLYESFGFRTVGVRPRYYHSEDAIMMEKSVIREGEERITDLLRGYDENL